MTLQRSALITGITGQDGSYLAEFLLEKGYKVYGLVRQSSTINNERIKHILSQIELINGDLLEQQSLWSAVVKAQPDEIYNLAAQSSPAFSFEQPTLTADISGLGVTRLLEALRKVKPEARFFQASTSEVFGRNRREAQDEETPFSPHSPYGVAKVYAHWITINYRESYDLFCSTGILFNHESSRRAHEFVTRKITQGAARIKLGLANELRLGNIDARRDWGYAGDYVRAMWAILQHDKPDDFVIATGIDHSIRDFCKVAFSYLDLNWQEYVVIDEQFFRPGDGNVLRGNPAKIKQILAWEPQVDFTEMVQMMVEHDLLQIKHEEIAPAD